MLRPLLLLAVAAALLSPPALAQLPGPRAASLLSVTAVSPAQPQVLPNATVSVLVNVSNGGGADTVTLAASSQGPQSDPLVCQTPASTTIAAGGSATFRVNATARSNQTVGAYDTVVFVNGTTSQTSYRLTIEVVPPALRAYLSGPLPVVPRGQAGKAQMEIDNSGPAVNATLSAHVLGTLTNGSVPPSFAPMGRSDVVIPASSASTWAFEITAAPNTTRGNFSFEMDAAIPGQTMLRVPLMVEVTDAGPVHIHVSVAQTRLRYDVHAGGSMSLVVRNDDATNPLLNVTYAEARGLFAGPSVQVNAPGPGTVRDSIAMTLPGAQVGAWTLIVKVVDVNGQGDEAVVPIDVVDEASPATSVNLTWSPDNVTIAPGENASLEIVARERSGGGDMSPNLVFVEPDGGAALWASADPSYLTLLADSTNKSVVTIGAAPNATFGDHVLRARAIDRLSGALEGERDIVVRVEPHRDPLTPPITPARLTLRAAAEFNASANDSVLRFDAVATNEGDAPLTVTLGLRSEAITLGAVTSLRVDLAPGATGALSAGVTLSEPLAPGRYAIELLGDTGRGALAVAYANLTVRGADAPLLIDAPPALEVPGNGTATLHVRILSFDHAPRVAMLRATIDGAFTIGALPEALPIDAGGQVEALIVVHAPPGAGAGALGTLRLEAGDASATIALRVAGRTAVTAQPAVASTLEVASQYVAMHPAATGSLAIAGGALAMVPLLRRERARILLVAASLPLYTRLAKPTLLDAKQRARIHAIVAQRPGVHYSALRDETGLGAGALVHHLRILEKNALVTSRRDGKLRRYYAAGVAPGALASGPTSEQREILELLAERPLTRPEIARRLGLTQQGVSYHVKNLERSGHVIVRGAGGAALVTRVFVSERV